MFSLELSLISMDYTKTNVHMICISRETHGGRKSEREKAGENKKEEKRGIKGMAIHTETAVSESDRKRGIKRRRGKSLKIMRVKSVPTIEQHKTSVRNNSVDSVSAFQLIAVHLDILASTLYYPPI